MTQVQDSISAPTLEDLQELLKLWKQQYDFHHDLDPEYYIAFSDDLRIEAEKELQDLISSEIPKILISKDGTKINGFITFNEEKDQYFDALISEYGALKELFVAKDTRGKGVGKNLVAVAEKHFKDKGVNNIMIQCSSFNKTALAVYKSLGYMSRQELLYKKLDSVEK